MASASIISSYSCISQLSLKPRFWEIEPELHVTPEGTCRLMDNRSHRVLASFETGKPAYAQHHSKESSYYLDCGAGNTLYFITNPAWLCGEERELIPYDVEEFIRKKPEEYLDGGRLASKIKTTEYLVDCRTYKIICTICLDEVQNNQQMPTPLDYSKLICVQRTDYELAFYSSATRKCLWYLSFARFDAWFETARYLNLITIKVKMPYDKKCIKVYQACHPDSLRDENKATDHTQAIQGTSKNQKKKKARKAKNDRTTANAYEKMIIESDETDTVHISESQKEENGTKGSKIDTSSEKRLVLDMDEDDTKVIKPKRKKMENGSNETDDVHINEELLVCKKEIVKESNNTNGFEVNGDKDVETEVPDLNHNLVGCHFVKYPPDSALLVSKRCVCSLHDLMSLINNWPVQAQQTTEVLMAMELLKPNNLVKLTWDIVVELSNLHKNGIAHGNLNPHNVYIDINAKAIIPKDPNADMSSSTADSFDNDCYNLGRINLFIFSNGEHKFCNTSNGDLNNSKDREDLLKFIKGYPEAYDITSRLLHHDKSLRPTLAFVYSHFFYWDHQKCRSYLEDACEQLKIHAGLEHDLESICTDVFDGTWEKKIHGGLLKNKNEHRRKMGFSKYNCMSMCDFLLFIRNVCSHYPEIPDWIKKSVGGDRDQFVTYIRCRYPKLLTEVYKVFDKYDWKNTSLHKYHTTI